MKRAKTFQSIHRKGLFAVPLLWIMAVLGTCQDEQDVDPGKPPAFTPPPPVLTTVKGFPGTPEHPVVLPSEK